MININILLSSMHDSLQLSSCSFALIFKDCVSF